METYTMVLRAASLKVHSVVYKGETKQGSQVAFYVPWEVVRAVGNIGQESRAGLESLPQLEVSFKEAK